MIIDGKAIAADVLRGVKEKVADLGRTPTLAVFTCAPTFATKNYLGIKTRKAEEAGIGLSVVELPAESSTEDVLARMREEAAASDGVVVQLPFPAAIDMSDVLAHLPKTHDVDVIGREAGEAFEAGTWDVLPPVAGAIAEVVKRHGISFRGKRVAVVGRGRLVGGPAAVWAAGQGGDVAVVDAQTKDLGISLQAADIIISGAGVPGLITPDAVKEGVVVFDAGTSEEGGRVAGDADPAVADKAAFFTPVPGGIGPVTVAKLLENLVRLAEKRER